MSIAELHNEYRLARVALAEGRATVHQARTAFERWFRASCAAGRPPDALRPHIEDEYERFMSLVIPGVDGHSYWSGAKEFRTNAGAQVRPVRWWWFHLNTTIDRKVHTLIRICDDAHCIAPHHYGAERWKRGEGFATVWNRETIKMKLQALGSKLGRTPTFKELEREHLYRHTIKRHYGTVADALEAAGLQARRRGLNVYHAPTGKPVFTDDDIYAVYGRVRAELGSAPTRQWWDDNINSPSIRTIGRRFGSWDIFLQKVSENGYR